MKAVWAPAALLLALVASSAVADSGVVEINQARALAGGVTASDTAGFPVTLDAPGSYRLAGNLDLSALAGAENLDAIEVLADGVSLDLGGFAIRGPTVCTGTPPTSDLSCAPLGTGRGVDAAGRKNVTVSNGTLTGTGSTGVSCSASCLVHGLHVENAGGHGILAGNGSVVRDNTAQRNRFAGIGFTGTGGLAIQANSVRENGSDGISSGAGDLIEGNSSRHNRGHGIFANPNTLVRGNTAVDNHLSGIRTFSGCLVVHNVANDNGAFGLELGTPTAYGGNMIGGNDDGSVNGGAQVLPNFCDTDTVCP